MTNIKPRSGLAKDIIPKLKREAALARQHSPFGNPPVVPFEFEDVKIEEIKFLFIVLDGMTSTLKTTFICSAPDPVDIFAFEPILKGVVDRFIKVGKKIRSTSVGVIAKETLVENQEQADEVWTRFKKTYDIIMEDSITKTIGIDTGTHLWEIAQWSEMGRIEIAQNALGKEVYPFHYGRVNQQFRALMTKAKECEKNVIITHRMKEIWDKKGNPTDKYKLAGFKDMGYESQVYITATKECAFIKGKPNVTKPVFILNKCTGLPQGMEGKRYEGYEQCNFPYIAGDITGTSIEEWR